uniref:Zinc finger CCCH domain-containing protein 13 n=1 Tax=Anthurium amnicola TaxID=1678845 RepID=A0A1D1YT29_9ARAE
MFDDHKCQLEMILEEKAQEVDKLSAKIGDLETQLNKEQEDYKRFTSKIKKFIKAHGRILRAQEELKRSQSRLQRVCNQLDSDTSKPGNNEEDSSVHVVSDGEPSGDVHMSPSKKKLRFESGATEETKPGSFRKRERYLGTSTKLDKLSWSEALISESENKSKESETTNTNLIKNDVQRYMGDEHMQKDIGSSPTVAPSSKVRFPDSGHLLPSTSMAAHAVDEFIEAMDVEEKSGGDAAVAFENGTVNNKTGLPLLPRLPPKAAKSNYCQYEGDDEEVDVEEVEVDTGDADISSEVEIEQV